MSNNKKYFSLSLLAILAYCGISVFFIMASKNIVDFVCVNAITDHPLLLLNSTLRFNSEQNANSIKEWFGWYQPEPWGTWSSGERSYLYAKVDKVEGGDVCLLIHGQSILSKGHSRNRFKIFLNGKYVAEFIQTLEQPSAEGRVRIPAATIQAYNGNLALKLSSLDPISPSSSGQSTDTRILGFGVIDLQLVHCDP